MAPRSATNGRRLTTEDVDDVRKASALAGQQVFVATIAVASRSDYAHVDKSFGEFYCTRKFRCETDHLNRCGMLEEPVDRAVVGVPQRGRVESAALRV